MKRFVRIMMLLTLVICLVGCGNAKQESVEEYVQTNTESNLKETVDASSEDIAKTDEHMEEASQGDITVAMSMYSDNEQVGSLGRSYTSNNKQTTTHNGDIVLYNSSNIVVFYGSNSWSYTRLGKMDLSESEVTAMLSNSDVQLKITR